MNVAWITDVNKPGNFPQGGWWYVEAAPGFQKLAGYFETKKEAEIWMEDELLMRASM